jgi:hypothetical protein
MLTRTAIASLILGGLAFSAPVMAADQPAPPMAGKMHKMSDPVEARITSLHARLNITADQEGAWSQVADAMRDNAKSHEDLVKTKQANEATMTAAEDMAAYAEIAQNHADGVKKLAQAFQTLYDGLSADQKKAADEEFRAHKQRVRHRAHGAAEQH